MHMKYVQTLSIEEISVLIMQSKNTTTVQLHRGLEKLKLLSITYKTNSLLVFSPDVLIQRKMFTTNGNMNLATTIVAYAEQLYVDEKLTELLDKHGKAGKYDRLITSAYQWASAIIDDLDLTDFDMDVYIEDLIEHAEWASKRYEMLSNRSDG